MVLGFIEKNSKSGFISKYRISSKETRGSYFFFEGPNAGLIRIWPEFVHFCLLFLSFLRILKERGSYLRASLIRGFTVFMLKANCNRGDVRVVQGVQLHH